jgi:hypothetical protein
MGSPIRFTKAQVRRAVRAAESAGLHVRRITITSDGAITIDTGENAPVAVDSSESSLAASWDDM